MEQPQQEVLEDLQDIIMFTSSRLLILFILK